MGGTVFGLVLSATSLQVEGKLPHPTALPSSPFFQSRGRVIDIRACGERRTARRAGWVSVNGNGSLAGWERVEEQKRTYAKCRPAACICMYLFDVFDTCIVHSARDSQPGHGGQTW